MRSCGMSRSESFAEIMDSYFGLRSSQTAKFDLTFGLVLNVRTQESTRAWLRFAKSHPVDEACAGPNTSSINAAVTGSTGASARGAAESTASPATPASAVFLTSPDLRILLMRFTSPPYWKRRLGR